MSSNAQSFLQRTSRYASNAPTVYKALLTLQILIYVSASTTVYGSTFVHHEAIDPRLLIPHVVLSTLLTAIFCAAWLLECLWGVVKAERDAVKDVEGVAGSSACHCGGSSGGSNSLRMVSIIEEPRTSPPPSNPSTQQQRAHTPTSTHRSLSFSTVNQHAETIREPVPTPNPNYNATVEDAEEEIEPPFRRGTPRPPLSPQAPSPSLKRRSWKNPVQQQPNPPSIPGEDPHENWQKRTSRLPEGMRAGYADREVF
ncbi:hypothetical protein W97_02359 [Coniosporium apollinis CBS 100218]|uniref:Uncharacterized protein n=1 Tax=Coniosporium apollinis (strain CBS 100218) TaxID=1168221 RepID=R7YML3_CONA1|nr:uncharacterized protein W97_02359 [Coniosporium apollinis CBS 100218]EON63132.1 hypothetical protein W97_02359 [Coniosporium apollinis CBS 100218]